MKYSILIQIIALISLTSQLNAHLHNNQQFPIKAVSILHGETTDQQTNQTFKINGIVRFTQSGQNNVLVSINISGLPPFVSVKRGFHVHTYGISDYSNNNTAVCTSTGPHYNPFN